MILDLLAQTLNMNINGTGVADILIAPDLVKELLACEYLVCEEARKYKSSSSFGGISTFLPSTVTA